MEYYRLPLYIAFGVMPSLIWLSYYLSKDLHPEPRRMVIKIFLYGCLITIPVFFIQVALSNILEYLTTAGYFDGVPMIGEIIKWFLVIAFTEELLKYMVVRLSILKSPELDEPLDIMLYMVIAALGFAALENIFYLFSPIDNIPFHQIIQTTIVITLIRFIGATFLHTLCSALIGYFLALSSLRLKKKAGLTVLGIILATLLHGLYDFSIITLQGPLNFIIPTLVILVLVVFMVYDFDEIKKIKGICKI